MNMKSRFLLVVVLLAQGLPLAGLAGDTSFSAVSSFVEPESPGFGLSFQIVEAGRDDDRPDEEPLPGELLLPESVQPVQDGREKQCMTVCARWGEDCMLINKGAGGMERKCRRTCQQFAEECF